MPAGFSHTVPATPTPEYANSLLAIEEFASIDELIAAMSPLDKLTINEVAIARASNARVNTLASEQARPPTPAPWRVTPCGTFYHTVNVDVDEAEDAAFWPPVFANASFEHVAIEYTDAGVEPSSSSMLSSGWTSSSSSVASVVAEYTTVPSSRAAHSSSMSPRDSLALHRSKSHVATAPHQSGRSGGRRAALKHFFGIKRLSPPTKMELLTPPEISVGADALPSEPPRAIAKMLRAGAKSVKGALHARPSKPRASSAPK